MRILAALDSVSKELNATPAQVSLAWLLAKGVTAPIASATSVKQLHELLSAVDLKLDARAVALLDEASAGDSADKRARSAAAQADLARLRAGREVRQAVREVSVSDLSFRAAGGAEGARSVCRSISSPTSGGIGVTSISTLMQVGLPLANAALTAGARCSSFGSRARLLRQTLSQRRDSAPRPAACPAPAPSPETISWKCCDAAQLRLFITTTTIGSPCRAIVSNSAMVKPIAPSPTRHSTGRFGCATCAPSDSPSPNPTAPRNRA